MARYGTAILAAFALASITPATAAPGGRLGVLPLGFWQCGVPGDAMGIAFTIDERLSFLTKRNSSYRTNAGSGTYLLTGTTLTFTRGPLKGMVFDREERNRLRLAGDAAEPQRVICNRRAHREDSPQPFGN